MATACLNGGQATHLISRNKTNEVADGAGKMWGTFRNLLDTLQQTIITKHMKTAQELRVLI
jgi:hypothetical protein